MTRHTPRPIPRHRIRGAAAVVVPFDADGDADWETFAQHLTRIAKVGLTPAVSSIPNATSLLSTELQVGAVHHAQEIVGGDFFAGVHVTDAPGDRFSIESYLSQVQTIQHVGATPIVFPSHGMNGLSDSDWLTALGEIGRTADKFMVAEVDPARAPTGIERSFDAYAGLLRIRSCVGAVHATLSRHDEWNRLYQQPTLRRDFLIYSSNERAIDMATYGCNYLLTTAGMAPELFARRDRLWAEADPSVHDLQDLLQYLAMFVARDPIESLPHSALQFLRVRGWFEHDFVPAGIPERPNSDRAVLAEIANRLGLPTSKPTSARKTS